ncbi:MAG: Bug family tripartite tricarboxylate transporter substrate binding protein [Alphaproteobacteria bacterium]
MTFAAPFLSRCATAAVPLALAILVGAPATAQDVSFAKKTVTLIVGSTPGGSTDASARLLQRFFAKHLPGKPDVVVSNRPGAKGLTAQNYFANQVKPDGLNVLVASGSQIDPTNYRVPQSKYDPTTYTLVGGLDIGGSFLIVRKDQVAALTDKSKPPVPMGSVSGVPRSGMNMTGWGIKYLGWNAKWVSGYRGTPELMLALERGEIGMTSFANQEMKTELLDKNKYTILYQSGINAGKAPAETKGLEGVPLFASAVDGKITGKIPGQAFEYWRAISSIIKWVALPPNTPAKIAATYRGAFARSVADPEFKVLSKKMNEEVSIIKAEDLEKQIKDLAEMPPEAFSYMLSMLKEQGLNITESKKKKKKKKKKE